MYEFIGAMRDTTLENMTGVEAAVWADVLTSLSTPREGNDKASFEAIVQAFLFRSIFSTGKIGTA